VDPLRACASVDLDLKEPIKELLCMTAPLDWEKLVAELESQALAIRTSEGAKTLKFKVQEAITGAESNYAPSCVINRLDFLMMTLTESSRENVCTNTRCPHYDKKCKMR
jgi:hypothetical protein